MGDGFADPPDGIPTLHIAAKNGHVAAVKLLSKAPRTYSTAEKAFDSQAIDVLRAATGNITRYFDGKLYTAPGVGGNFRP